MENGDYEINRVMAIRHTDENFYLAVKPPLSESEEGYKKLDTGASSQHTLDEGSQIFVYPRKDFVLDGDKNEFSHFQKFVELTAEEIGKVALDKHILPTHAKIVPYRLEPVESPSQTLEV